MKLTRLTGLLMALLAGVSLQHAAAQALNLHALSNVYTQNFDGLTISTNPFTGGPLPGEWVVYTNVTSTQIGSVVFFDGNAVDSWTNLSGGFKNFAGTFSYAGGTNYTGDEDPGVQTNELNRALGIRQIGAFGDPGASFVLKIADTTNCHNFSMSVDFLNLDASSPRTTTWTVEYGYADPEYLVPTSFFPAATYTNVAGAFTTYHTNIAFPDGTINNFNGQVWIRVSALTPSDGSGNRESFGIDNVGLTWDTGTGGFTRVRVVANPASITVYSNATASYTVNAAGTAPVSYQWLRNGTPLSDGGNIVGSQTFTLQVRNATPADQASYSCAVSNTDTNGVVYNDTSHTATLTVTNAPSANIGFLRTLVDPTTLAVTNASAMWRVTGLITTATNITTGNTASYYIQDSTTGINLFVTGGSSFRPNIGDEVTAIGFLSSFGGSIELFVDLTGSVPARNATLVQALSNNIAAYPAPKLLPWTSALSVAPTNTDLDFNYACSLVMLTNVYFGTNTGKVLPSNSNPFYWVTNSSGKAIQLLFYSRLANDLTNKTLPNFAYSVQGVLIPFTTTPVGQVITNGNYEVGITRWADVVSSPLQIAVSHSGGNSTITWTAVPLTYSYSVLAATDVAGPYTPLATGLKFTTSAGTYTDTGASGPYKFYRVTSP